MRVRLTSVAVFCSVLFHRTFWFWKETKGFLINLLRCTHLCWALYSEKYGIREQLLFYHEPIFLTYMWQLQAKRSPVKSLTSVLTPRFDDFGPTFTCVFHSLGHSFSGHLIWVIGGAHCDLALYGCQQCQIRSPWTEYKLRVWIINVRQIVICSKKKK